VTDGSATVETASAADGTAQLRRRWAAEQPKAALQLVHGIGEHSGRYDHVGRFYAERGYDVACFDNRGFGSSGGRRGHIDSFSTFLDDIEPRLAERRELGVPVILYGHSLGGLIVLNYLLDDRPKPDLAVLSAPALNAEVVLWKRLAAPILGRLAPTMFFAEDSDGTGLSRDPEVASAYVNDPLVILGGTASIGHQVFEAMKSARARLSTLSVPTYVFHGDADPIVPHSASEPLADLDVVTYKTWPGLRHECHNEPEQNEVMADTIAWLDQRLAE
jgi:alpha-beta hydrolase superfamily lysophospholipase